VTNPSTNALVTKLWNYCTVLRDDGLSTIDYVEQLSYLLFLKMADELANLPKELGGVRVVPQGFDWPSLISKKGAKLEVQYRNILQELAKHPGTTLGTVFAKSQNRISDPAKLEKLVVELIGKQDWTIQGVDVKGDAYEGLLAKGAEDQKTGAGQYFTPRAVIDAMVDCALPLPTDTIIDPACGTAGFLIAAGAYIREHHQGKMTREQAERLTSGALRGVELVPGTARLAAMNMLLHNLCTPDSATLIETRDALAAKSEVHATLVLANPPFGKKSSITVIGEGGKAEKEDIAYERPDFWTTTTNKQLNFVQHIASLLAIDGRAAVVLPDNVLFEGGVGEKVRRRLLQDFDVHTMLRLPTGIFYAGGVKANVLFFDKKIPRTDNQPWTTKLWIYDFRTAQHFTGKQIPLRRHHLDDFVRCYRPGVDRARREETNEFKVFTYDELIARDKVNLDITWLKDPAYDNADSQLPPAVIAREIVEDLEAALAEFAAVADALAAADYTQ
jgi:type I restriction enzyme M protein